MAQTVQVQGMDRWISIAQAVVEWWRNEGDADMVMDAQARVDRLLQGIVDDIDIDGLNDWAEYFDM